MRSRIIDASSAPLGGVQTTRCARNARGTFLSPWHCLGRLIRVHGLLRLQNHVAEVSAVASGASAIRGCSSADQNLTTLTPTDPTKALRRQSMRRRFEIDTAAGALRRADGLGQVRPDLPPARLGEPPLWQRRPHGTELIRDLRGFLRLIRTEPRCRSSAETACTANPATAKSYDAHRTLGPRHRLHRQ